MNDRKAARRWIALATCSKLALAQVAGLFAFGAAPLVLSTPAHATCPPSFTSSTIAPDGDCIFRDYNTDGVSGSGPYNPQKSQIRSWGDAIGAAITSALSFNTQTLIATASPYNMSTSATDNTAALLSFWSACLNTGGVGHLCLIPPGQYAFTQDVFLDTSLSAAVDRGWDMLCTGQTSTTFNFAAGKHLTIGSSVAEGTFAGRWFGCNVNVNNPGGPALQLGNSNQLDGLNELQISGMRVYNAAYTNAATSVVQVDEVFNSHFFITANSGCSVPQSSPGVYIYVTSYGACTLTTAGDALQLVNSHFNVFEGSYSNAYNGVNTETGGNVGNVILGPDMEIVYNAWSCSGSGGGNNTIYSGTFVDYYTGPGKAYVGGCQAYAGNSIYYPDMTDTSSYVSGVNPNEMAIKGLNYAISGPTLTSATRIQNETGFNMQIAIYGGSVTSVCYGNSATVGTGICFGGFPTGSPPPVTLNSGQYIDVTETGASWVWNPVN